jgi:hypothetical protein
MQRLIRLIDASSRSADDLSPLPSVGINTDPGARLPLLVFLYGDASATYVNEALAIREDVLRSHGAVYGLGEIDLRDGVSDGKMWNLVHYYSENTGGEYYSSADSQRFASILGYIVSRAICDTHSASAPKSSMATCMRYALSSRRKRAVGSAG